MNASQAIAFRTARIGSHTLALVGAVVMTLALLGGLDRLATSAPPAGLLAQMHTQPAQG